MEVCPSVRGGGEVMVPLLALPYNIVYCYVVTSNERTVCSIGLHRKTLGSLAFYKEMGDTMGKSVSIQILFSEDDAKAISKMAGDYKVSTWIRNDIVLPEIRRRLSGGKTDPGTAGRGSKGPPTQPLAGREIASAPQAPPSVVPAWAEDMGDNARENMELWWSGRHDVFEYTPGTRSLPWNPDHPDYLPGIPNPMLTREDFDALKEKRAKEIAEEAKKRTEGLMALAPRASPNRSALQIARDVDYTAQKKTDEAMKRAGL